MIVARFYWITTALLVDIMHLGSKYHFVQVSFILNIILGAVCLVTYFPSLQVQLIPLRSWTGSGSNLFFILALLAIIDAWPKGALSRLLVILGL